MPFKKRNAVLKKIASIFLAIIIQAGVFCPVKTFAAVSEPTVRIGYYEDNNGFQSGFSDRERKSGYAYEYYQEIAKYTGWKYSYVYGSWAEMYEKLLSGEIDIMAGVSKTEDRLDKMLFPESAMGSELYYVFIPSGSNEITGDPATLNGKTIAINENSLMLALFEKFVSEEGLDCQINTYPGSTETENALKNGEADGIVITDNYTINGLKPAIKIGGSEIYFAVSKGRPDILRDINYAQERIFAASPYYNSALQQKYFDKSILRQALTDSEMSWIKRKGSVAIGYLDSFLPYCGTNTKTGAVSGLITTLQAEIADFMDISAELVSFHTYEEMLAALQTGTIDAAFPIYGDVWLLEQKGLVQTDAVVSEPAAVAYTGDYGESTFEKIAFAKTGVIGSDYIEPLFPKAEVVSYESLEKCLSALSSKKVSAVIGSRSALYKLFVSNGSYSLVHTAYIDKSVSITMAVPAGETEFVSILNKAIGNIDDSLISDAVSNETYTETSYSFKDFIQQNPLWTFLTVVVVSAFVIFWCVIYSVRTKRSARLLFEEKEKTEAVNADLMKQIKISKAWQDASETDALTGLLNRGGGETRIKELLESGAPGLFCIFDIDSFKRINDIYGHTTGDEALKTIAGAMRGVFRANDILIRFGGDEFAIFAPAVQTRAEAESCITRLIDNITEAEVPGMENQSLGISLGAMLCREKISFRAVYRKCDSALYSCKDENGKKYKIISEGEEKEEAEPQESSLEEAIKLQDYKAASKRVLRHELQTALDNTNISTFIYYSKKKVIFCSEKAQQMYRTPPVIEDVPESYIRSYVLEEDRESYRRMYDKIAAGAESASTVFRSINEIFQSKVTLTTLSRDKDGAPVIVLGIIEDQSDEYGIVRALGQNYSAILTADLSENRAAPRRNITMRFSEIGKFFKKKHSYDEFIEFYAKELVEEGSKEKFLSKFERKRLMEALAKDGPVVERYKRVSEGETHYMEIRVVPSTKGKGENCVIAFRCVDDVLERELAVKYDDVTGILRKNSFFEATAEFLGKNQGGNYVMASLDLDSFSTINDTIGLETGDLILRKTGDIISKNKKLAEYVRVCGHLYADNFAACCEFKKGEEKIFMRTIFEELKESFPKIPIALRFGFCGIDDPKTAADIYCGRANTALRSIKGNFERHYAWFSKPMLETHAHEQELESTMVEALEKGQFVPFFQPQYDYITKELTGAEALVRWFDPKKGVVQPKDFIPYFEKCGFIYKLDKNIWEQVFSLMRSWLDKGLNIPHISVNVSIKDISRGDFFEKFAEMLKKYGLSPEQVHLEFTESAFRDNYDLQTQAVKKMKTFGFVCEMDDFGSGYSSLNSLKDVPIDILKLDMKFLENSSGKGGNILSSVVHMASAIDIPVIAEGVETKEQAEFLKTIGCRFMQGFYFSKPVCQEDFEKLLSTEKTQTKAEDFSVGIDNAADFLDASTQSNLIFNSFVGGAGIFEYTGGSLKVLRVNDKFFEVCDENWESYRRFLSDILQKITEETRPAAVEMLEEAIKTGEEKSCYHQSAFPGRSGKRGWFYDRARLLAKKTDSYIFYISVENITERIELEEKNAQLNTELSNIVKNIPDGIAKGWIGEDKSIHLQYFSPVFEKLLGYELVEFIKINTIDPYALVHPEDIAEVSAALDKTFETGEPLHMEYRLRHKNGTYIWLNVLGNCYSENGKRMIYLIYSDASEKREKEEALRIRESEFRNAVI